MYQQNRTTAWRRTILGGALLTGVTAMTAPHLTSCSPFGDQPASGRRRTSSSPTASGSARGKVLLAYFSRPGENYYYGDRTVVRPCGRGRLARVAGPRCR
ncbi:hypothetical protein ACIHCV_22570 [Streptomyces sp. NPDC051956]|uniref:hypothetical protein n=1 Tax=Streptomyces sp. NPDC051956 TaxID=3365677 RepID=UPI0037D8C9CB